MQSGVVQFEVHPVSQEEHVSGTVHFAAQLAMLHLAVEQVSPLHPSLHVVQTLGLVHPTVQ